MMPEAQVSSKFHVSDPRTYSKSGSNDAIARAVSSHLRRDDWFVGELQPIAPRPAAEADAAAAVGMAGAWEDTKSK